MDDFDHATTDLQAAQLIVENAAPALRRAAPQNAATVDQIRLLFLMVLGPAMVDGVALPLGPELEALIAAARLAETKANDEGIARAIEEDGKP